MALLDLFKKKRRRSKTEADDLAYLAKMLIFWKEQILGGLDMRKSCEFDIHWDDLKKFEYGDQWSEEAKKRAEDMEQFVINLTQRHISLHISELHHQQPRVQLKPRRYRSFDYEPTTESDSGFRRKMGWETPVPRFIWAKHQLIAQQAFLRAQQAQQQIATVTEGGRSLDAAGQPVVSPEEIISKIPPPEELWAGHLVCLEELINRTWMTFETEEEIKRSIKDALLGHGFGSVDIDPNTSYPRVKRIHPLNMVIDPLATESFESARWVAVREIIPYDRFRIDNRFVNREQVKPSDGTEIHKGKKTRVAVEHNKGVLWNSMRVVEIWHIYSKIGMGEFAEKLMRNRDQAKPSPDDNEYLHFAVVIQPKPLLVVEPESWPGRFDPEQFHISSLKFFDRDDVPWGYSQLSAAMGLQRYMNWAASYQMLAARIEAGFFLAYDPNRVEHDIVQEIAYNPGPKILPVTNLGRPGHGDAIQRIDFGSVNFDIQRIADWAERLHKELVGDLETSTGSLRRSTRTAAEAQLLRSAAQSRILPLARPTDNFLRSLALKMVQVARLRLNRAQVAQIVGDELARYWIDAADLGPEYQIENQGPSPRVVLSDITRQPVVRTDLVRDEKTGDMQEVERKLHPHRLMRLEGIEGDVDVVVEENAARKQKIETEKTDMYRFAQAALNVIGGLPATDIRTRILQKMAEAEQVVDADDWTVEMPLPEAPPEQAPAASAAPPAPTGGIQ